jgi:hypothetical protein
MKNWLVYLLAGALIFSGCKDDDEDPVPAPVSNCVAGKGDFLSLNIRTVHHTRPVSGCKVYIKYNTNSFPGEITSVYDDSLQIPNDTVAGTFSGLKCGKYYLYATGIDSLLDPTVWIVKGGIPFSTEYNDTTLNVSVYVTEGD